jgi:long-chain fatty acid transport protein
MTFAARIALAVSPILAASTQQAFSLGFRITDLGAKGTARGGAVVATADDPSAVYNNPAGITQTEGLNSQIGLNVIGYESKVSHSSGTYFDTRWDPGVVPHSYATLHHANSPIALGFGAYSPFGLGFEYDDLVPFRTLAKKAYIQFGTWNLVAAWKFNETLSIAAGATVNYSRTMLSRGVIVPGDEFQFRGSGVGYGFNLGLLWKPHPMHAFGISYFSAIDIEYSGHSHLRIPSFAIMTPAGVFNTTRIKTEQDADATINFPGTLRAGYSFRPTPDWNFEFDVEWTDWDRLNTVTLHQPSGALAIPFNYESSWFYEFGVSRKLPWNLTASAGYIYSENSVPNESFNPLVPDSNRHVFSAGLGQELGRYNWNVSYQYAYGPRRTISQGTPVDGNYKFESHAVSFTLGYRF